MEAQSWNACLAVRETWRNGCWILNGEQEFIKQTGRKKFCTERTLCKGLGVWRELVCTGNHKNLPSSHTMRGEGRVAGDEIKSSKTVWGLERCRRRVNF